jgi:hypothetical protein
MTRALLIAALLGLLGACATTPPKPAPKPAEAPAQPSPYVNPGWDNPPPQ